MFNLYYRGLEVLKDILGRGVLNKFRGELVKSREYKIGLLDDSYIGQMLELQDMVMETLDSSDLYKPDSREFLEKSLDNGAVILGAFIENKLICHRFINFPREEKRNFGRDLNLPKDELMHVAHFESTLVHPDYRGNRLQGITFDYAIDLMKRLDYYHICTTISPRNYYSLLNILKKGLFIKKIDKKYVRAYKEDGGKLRFVLHKNLKEEPIKNFDEKIYVDSKNIEKHRELLNTGYIGYRAEKRNDGFGIIYVIG